MYKTMGMMRCIDKFHRECNRVVNDSAKSEKKISLGLIEQALPDVVYELTQMKFQPPTQPQADMERYFDNFLKMMDEKFYSMKDFA